MLAVSLESLVCSFDTFSSLLFFGLKHYYTRRDEQIKLFSDYYCLELL